MTLWLGPPRQAEITAVGKAERFRSPIPALGEHYPQWQQYGLHRALKSVDAPRQTFDPRRQPSAEFRGQELSDIEAVVDLLEPVACEGEHEDQRLGAGAADGVPGVGRNVDRRARTERHLATINLHAPVATERSESIQ